MSLARITIGVICALGLVAAPAAAERDPWQQGTPGQTYARPGGRVRVHFVTTTADAVLATDADASGVPDFVEEVALRGDEVLARFAAAGFRAPLSDGTLGGDDRLDIYLRDLAGADGSFGVDSCTDTPFRCVGDVTMENDFVGYPSAVRFGEASNVPAMNANADSASAIPSTRTHGGPVRSNRDAALDAADGNSAQPGRSARTSAACDAASTGS